MAPLNQAALSTSSLHKSLLNKANRRPNSKPNGKALTAVLITPVLLPACVMLTTSAHADDVTPGVPNAAVITQATASNPDESSMSLHKQGWDVSAGAGVVVRPTFMGSDRYVATPLPFGIATYDDMLTISPEGISVYWHNDTVRAGLGLTYNGGRDDEKSSGLFHQGDKRLEGLGNISNALGIRAFATYNAKPLLFNASVTQLTGSNNDGLLADAGVSLPFALSRQLMLRPHVGVTWANQNYMQTYFGVTATQAADSQFSQYTASAGFRDYNAGLNINYRFNQRWFLDVNADVRELAGSAAASPISFSNTQYLLMMMVGYHFQ